MSWGRRIVRTMKLRRRVVAIVLLGAMVLCGEVVRASAQGAPPDLRMLMNLDLFESRHNNAKGAPTAAASPGDDSMLDQIRTLDAMGYLGNHGGANGNGASAPRATAAAPESSGGQPQAQRTTAAEPAEQPAPESQPSFDAEGPQP
jgi:hypothetical protein